MFDFDVILYVPSTFFQFNRDGSSWVEPVLNRCNVCYIKCYKEIACNPQYRCNVCNIKCYKEIVSNPQYKWNVCYIECYKEM